MDFGLSPDQESLQSYARDFLTKECPSATVRAAMDSDVAHDKQLWDKMAALGWMGIAIPEEHGGGGMSYVDLAVLVEEMGRALVPGPFFSTVCLASVVIADTASDTQSKSLLPRLAAGELIATLAYTESSGSVEASGITMPATASGDGFSLTGTKMFVPDAHVADTLIVAARTSPAGENSDRGVTLFLVDAKAKGVSASQLETMDTTRRWCEITFDNVTCQAANILGTVDEGWAPLSTSIQKSIALLCAECVGGSHKVLDMSVEYAKSRIQFGRPIGSFQAVKHRCADMLVDVEMARSAMYYASWAASDGPEELEMASSVAKAWCGDAYSRVAASGIQVHGGIGFTWEHDMHLYFKRAKSNEVLLGSPTHHRDVVARLVSKKAD